MRKKIGIYILVFGLLFLGSYNLHGTLLKTKGIDLPFSLLEAYIFHAVFSLLICIIFLVGASKPKILEQLGYIYLVTVLIKLFVYSGLHKDALFGEPGMATFERFNLLLPVFVFLPVEVYFISKILKQNTFPKN